MGAVSTLSPDQVAWAADALCGAASISSVTAIRLMLTMRPNA